MIPSYHEQSLLVMNNSAVKHSDLVICGVQKVFKLSVCIGYIILRIT